MENSAVPKKKGFEEEHKDSDDDSSDDEQEKKPEAPKLSKKKLRRMNRFTVAELKQVSSGMTQSALEHCWASAPPSLLEVLQGRLGIGIIRERAHNCNQDVGFLQTLCFSAGGST